MRGATIGTGPAIAGASGEAVALLQRVVPAAPPPARPSVQLAFAADGRADGTALEVASEDAIPVAADARAGFVALATREARGVVVRLLDDGALERRLLVTLEGAHRASLRLSADALAIGDDRGRALAIELSHGAMTRSQRV